MKKAVGIIFMFLIFIFAGCGPSVNTVSFRSADPAFAMLDNYGYWVNMPGLGNTWRPFNEIGWQPYSDGQWVMTNRGWMWDSPEPYGWAVYHYGYWVYTDSYSWVWVPSYKWHSSMVRWYDNDGYIGWAPVPPPSISADYYNRYSDRIWVVVPEKHFLNPQVGKYRNEVPSSQIISIRNTGSGRAPDARRIERATNTQIRTVTTQSEQIRSGGRELERVRVSGTPENRSEPVRNQIGRPSPANTNPARTEPANRTGGGRIEPKHDTPANNGTGNDVRKEQLNNTKVRNAEQQLKKLDKAGRNEVRREEKARKKESVRLKKDVKKENKPGNKKARNEKKKEKPIR